MPDHTSCDKGNRRDVTWAISASVLVNLLLVLILATVSPALPAVGAISKFEIMWAALSTVPLGTADLPSPPPDNGDGKVPAAMEAADRDHSDGNDQPPPSVAIGEAPAPPDERTATLIAQETKNAEQARLAKEQEEVNKQAAQLAHKEQTEREKAESQKLLEEARRSGAEARQREKAEKQKAEEARLARQREEREQQVARRMVAEARQREKAEKEKAEEARRAELREERERQDARRVAYVKQGERSEKAVLERAETPRLSAERSGWQQQVQMPEKTSVPLPPSRLATVGDKPALNLPMLAETGPSHKVANPSEQKTGKRGNVIASMRGDLKLIATGDSAIKILVQFRPFPRSRRNRVQTRSEARREQTIQPTAASTGKDITEAVIQTALEGVYIFSAESEGGKGAVATFTLKIFESGGREKTWGLGLRRIWGKTALVKVLMRDGVVWDEDSAFTGNLKESDGVTKFNTATGLVWKEFQE